MAAPLVHILVINWNGREHLEACFDSLLAGTYAPVRFVLIDNASDDGSVEFVRDRYGRDPRVEIVPCDANLGWSRGNNVGIRRAIEAGADYVLLLNNDTAVAPDAVAHLVALAEADATAGALAPKMVLFDYPAVLNSVGLACSLIGSSWDVGIGRLDGPRWDEGGPVLGACGGACFLRVAALRKAGLLPEGFDIYLDDLDLSLRIWNAGYTIERCPEAVVRHKFGATMGQGRRSRRKYYLNTRNRMYVLLRHFPLSKALAVVPAFGLGECRALGRALLEGEPWRVTAHARAWLAAVAYVPRALAHRRRMAKAGFAACRFWPLIDTRRMFFGGVELPAEGWYRARDVAGRRVRPMSVRAGQDVEAGRLRVTLVNCYPALGSAHVDLRMDGRRVATLETDATVEEVVDVPDRYRAHVTGQPAQALSERRAW